MQGVSLIRMYIPYFRRLRNVNYEEIRPLAGQNA